jgi:hypothetical protein
MNEEKLLAKQEKILRLIVAMNGECKGNKTGKMISCCGSSLNEAFYNVIKCPLHGINCRNTKEVSIRALEKIESIRKLNYLEKLS